MSALTWKDVRAWPQWNGGPYLGQSRCQACGSFAVAERWSQGAAGDPFAFACTEPTCGRAVTGATYELAHRNFNRPLMTTPKELDAESLRHAGLVVAAFRGESAC